MIKHINLMIMLTLADCWVYNVNVNCTSIFIYDFCSIFIFNFLSKAF